MKGNVKIRQGTNSTALGYSEGKRKKLLIHFVSNEVILLK